MASRTHLLASDGPLARPPQLIDSLGVIPEILLAAHKDDGETRAEVKNLGDPLLLNVVERIGRVDGEADEDDVGIRVGEGTESVVILLSGGIPEGELDALAVDNNVGDVVLENGGNVDLVAASS